MESFSRVRRWRLVVGVVALALLAIPTAGAIAGTTTPFQQVVVVNPTAQPIPVSLTGSNAISGTVNVGNLPATQPVSGTVNVGNLPATQPVSGTVSIGNSPTVQLASDAKVTVANPAGGQPLLVQEVPSTAASAAEILPPTGNTIVGPALLDMDMVATYGILRGGVSINFCVTAVLLEANGNASFQANPTGDATWYNFRYGQPLSRCESNKQNANIDNHVAGTSLVYRIDRLP